MNRTFKQILAVVCALTFCLGLAACGGGTSDEQKSIDAFAGSWELVSTKTGDVTTTEEEIAIAKAFGVSVSIELNKDKSASFYVRNANLKGEWTPKNATSASMLVEGQNIDLTLKDGVLKLTQGGTEMSFRKAAASGSAASASAASAGAASSSARAAS